MNATRQHTLAVIRRLRAAGPVHRPARRLPRPQPPDLIALQYAQHLHDLVCNRARAAFDVVAPAVLDGLRRLRRRQGQTDSAPPHAAMVLAFDDRGQLLLGQRRDTGLLTLPGGGLQPGETPRRAAARELEEETGLTTAQLDLVAQRTLRTGARVWFYRCQVRGTPTGYFDPDQECSRWLWVDVSRGLPADVAARLSGPSDQADNVLLQLLPTRADAASDSAARLLDRAATHFATTWQPRAVQAVVAQFGKATDEHQRRQLDSQVRAAVGVSYSALERPIRDQVDGWVAANVQLVTTIPERYFDRLRIDIVDAYEGGTHTATLAEQFADRYQVSLNDASRIARDQVGKLNADVNHARQRSLGVTRATWRSMNDNRVCDECADLQGQQFDLDAGIDGVLPGYCHPMDRCYAEPDLSDLIGSDDTDQQGAPDSDASPVAPSPDSDENEWGEVGPGAPWGAEDSAGSRRRPVRRR